MTAKTIVNVMSLVLTRVIKQKRTLEFVLLNEVKSPLDTGSTDSPMLRKVQVGSIRILLEHTVQQTLLYIGLCSRRFNLARLLTNYHHQLCLQ